MNLIQTIQTFIISAVMAVNPLLLPPSLRTQIKPQSEFQKTIEENNKTVTCQIPSSCGGGTTSIKKWECDVAVCCETNGKWSFYSDGRRCSDTIPINITEPVAQPAKSVVTQNYDSDPPVHCQIHEKCGGGSIPLKKSECEKTYCCIYPDKAVFLRDKAQCTYNQGGTNNQITIPTYVPTPSLNLISCVVSYPCTGNTYTYQLDSSTCLTAQSQAANICRNSYTPTAPTQTGKSQVGIQKCKDEVRIKYNNLISGCYVRFQDTAANACARGYQDQSGNEWKNCEN